MTESAATSRIGVTGLAVMGANLARNIARRGTPVAVHNRNSARTKVFMESTGTRVTSPRRTAPRTSWPPSSARAGSSSWSRPEGRSTP